jgi:hypothetical protein
MKTLWTSLAQPNMGSKALLSQIYNAEDDDYVIVANLHLSSAFNLVNTNLLLKGPKIILYCKDLVLNISDNFVVQVLISISIALNKFSSH